MKSLIVLAAGRGSRTGLEYNKMLYEVKGKTILELLLRKFEVVDFFDELVVVVSKNEKTIIQDIVNNINIKNIKLVEGSSERFSSVYEGVMACKNDYIYIHDGARVNLNINFIKKLEEEVKSNPSISCFVLATKVKDTISIVEDGYIKGNLKRENLMAVQTPQVIKKEDYLKIYNKEEKFTDEGSLFHLHNYDVKIIESDDTNFKVTTKEDIKRLEEEYE